MAENTTNNNQVRFLTGTQENLNKMTTSQVGTFYLTSDTNRLYVGAQSGGPVLLNKAVAVVQNISSLPTEGIDLDSFYYLKEENILCVYAKQDKDSAPEWVQINHQAITTNVVNDALTFELDETNTADSLKYNVTLTQQTYNPATGELEAFTAVTPATGTLEIDGSALAGLVPEAASVGLTATEEEDGSIVIATSGDGSDEGANISIVSDGLAEVSVDASNNITISTAEIGLKAVSDPEDLDEDGILNSLTLTLESKDSNGKTSTLGETLIIKSGSGAEFKANFIDRKNTLQIQHAVMNTNSSVSANEGNYITGLTLQNGHVTGIEQEAFTDNDTTITGGTLDESYTLTLTDSNGSSEVEIDLSQIYEDAVDKSTEMFNVVNQALLYKGVVSSAKDLAEKKITNGHMYKIGADFTVTSGEGEEQTTISYSTGDLIIAYNDKWEIVPSGDEVDTTYEGVVTTSNTSIGYHIKDRNNSTPGEALTLNFGAGLAFDANSKTVSHATKTITPTTATAKLSHGGSFIIPIISNDNQGHIDTIVNKTFTLPTETEYFFLATNNTISLADSNNEFHGSLTLVSGNNNLNITAESDDSSENAVYTFNLQWESFDPETSTT